MFTIGERVWPLALSPVFLSRSCTTCSLTASSPDSPSARSSRHPLRRFTLQAWTCLKSLVLFLGSAVAWSFHFSFFVVLRSPLLIEQQSNRGCVGIFSSCMRVSISLDD